MPTMPYSAKYCYMGRPKLACLPVLGYLAFSLVSDYFGVHFCPSCSINRGSWACAEAILAQHVRDRYRTIPLVRKTKPKSFLGDSLRTIDRTLLQIGTQKRKHSYDMQFWLLRWTGSLFPLQRDSGELPTNVSSPE